MEHRCNTDKKIVWDMGNELEFDAVLPSVDELNNISSKKHKIPFNGIESPDTGHSEPVPNCDPINARTTNL